MYFFPLISYSLVCSGQPLCCSAYSNMSNLLLKYFILRSSKCYIMMRIKLILVFIDYHSFQPAIMLSLVIFSSDDRVQEIVEFFLEVKFLDKLHDPIIFSLERRKLICQPTHLRP